MGLNQSMKISKSDLLRLTDFDETELTPILHKYFGKDFSKEIGKDEFSRLWLDFEPKSPVELELYFFPAMDKNHNGLLSYREFIIGCRLIFSADQRERFCMIFDMYDIDQDGNISETELRIVSQCITRYVGIHLDLNVLETLITKMDRNADQQINREEFLDGLLKNYNIRNIMAPDLSFSG